MGGGSPSHTTTLTGSQIGVANRIGDRVTTGLNLPGGVKPYQGNTVAALPYSQQMQSQINGLDFSQGNQQAQAALGSILGGQAAGGNLDESSTNKLYQHSIFNPMMHSFQTKIAPQIKQAFAGAGRSFSSEAGFAQQRALSDMNVAGQQQLGQAVFQNQQLQAQYQNDALQRQLAGLSLAPQINNMQLGQLASQQALLQPFQQQQQNQLNAQYQKWATAQPYNNPWLSTGLQYIGQGQSAVYQPQVGPGSAIVNALAGQAAGAGLGAALGPGGQNLSALLGIGAGAAGGAAAAGAGTAAIAGSAGAADAFVPVAAAALALA